VHEGQNDPDKPYQKDVFFIVSGEFAATQNISIENGGKDPCVMEH